MSSGVARDGTRSRARRPPAEANVLFSGVLLVAAATGFRIWALHGAWFFFDDFYFIEEALRHPLSAAYLVRPYNGHLMPASTLLSWINARTDPWNFTLPATEMMVLFALAGLGMLRLLVNLFGHRWAVLAPLGLFLFSPILLPATMWWAAGVNQLPMLAALAFGLSAFVSYLRERRRRDLVAHLVWMLAGLAFIERTMVGLPVVWMVGLMYFASGAFPERCAHLWRHYRPAVLAHMVLLTAYLAAYVPWAMNFNATTITQRPLFGVIGNLAGIAFSSGFFGGPLTWQVSDVTQSEADPSQLVLVVGWVLLGVLLLAARQTRRRGLRPWLIPAFILMLNVGLIATSRAIFFGSQIALDYRFQTEVALCMALAVGLAFLPVLRAVESSEPVDAGWSIDSRGTVLVASVAFLALASISTARFPLRNLTVTSPRAYLDAVSASAHERPGTQLLNLATPAWFWAPLAYPTNTYRYQLLPLEDQLRIRDVTTDAASLVTDTGAFVPVSFHQARQQTAPSTGTCFGTLDGGKTRWSLDGPVIGIGWYVRLNYQVPAPTRLTITIDGAETTVDLELGRHYLLAPAAGTYDFVGLEVPDGSAPVCLQHLSIGSVDAAATS